VSTTGRWEWGDRERIPWWIPEEGDGFAVLYLPGTGDTLYDPNVDIQHGVDYRIHFFIGSETDGGTVLQVQQLGLDGSVIQVLQDFQSQSSPTNSDWISFTGTLEATNVPSTLGVFCETDNINSVDGTLYGCAVDFLIVDVALEPTTLPPTTSTTTTTTVAPPTEFVDWTFEDDTAGWTLGNSNGASWRRTNFSFTDPGIRPPTGGDHAIQVFSHDVYSGTVLAMSPLLVVGETGVVSVTVDFFITVPLLNYPAYLKLRRRLSYTTYDDNVAINMDPYGDQINQQWMTLTETFEGLTPGEEFNVVLEGNLGVNNDGNQIYVSRVYMEGVSVIPFEEEAIFDFADGLVGWQAGSMDGGKFEVMPYADVPPGLGMPQPYSENVLVATRFDLHSGVITIESPPISIEPLKSKQLDMRLWIRGSQVYPVLFRIGLKSIGGVYDQLPFFNLAQYGDADHQDWLGLGAYVEIPADPRQPFFQLVFEVDLGGDNDNELAIDLFVIRTVGAQ